MKSTPTTILFMGRIFETPWGGVREIANGLLREAAPICEADGRVIEVLVPRAGMLPFSSPALREVVLPRFGSNRILWDHWTVPNYANKKKNAVLYNVKLVLPERLRIPGFVSMHDLMYFPQPQKYNWREYLWTDSMYMRLMLRRTARRAQLVHTISRYTADDASDIFHGVPVSKFRPVPIAGDTQRFAPREWNEEDRAIWRELEEKGVRRPYIFHCGGLSRRKNLGVLAIAFRHFLRRHPDYQLVFTGGAKPTVPDPKLDGALRRLPSDSVVRVGKVEPRALALLYQNAGMFVFPSLYEGFGIPPLEAQAAGCPVICAGATSLPEVAGTSALMFDPRSPRQLLDAMHRVTADSSLREELIAAGHENVRRFTWEKTTRAWLRLADEAAR